MIKLIFVVLLVLSNQGFAEPLKEASNAIETEWASIYYSHPKSKQGDAYIRLLDKAADLSRQYPDAAEPLFWQAVLKASYADQQDAFSALSAILEARDLLIKAIKIDPKTMGGSAYVTLGTLYYMAPVWPISFGDDLAAQQMLEIALKINPVSIDANYFYGEFLMRHNRPDDAVLYFERATAAPARVEQIYADSQIKAEARIALKNTQERKISSEKGQFLSLFNPANANRLLLP